MVDGVSPPPSNSSSDHLDPKKWGDADVLDTWLPPVPRTRAELAEVGVPLWDGAWAASDAHACESHLRLRGCGDRG